MGLNEQLKRARKAAVPLVAIETPDPAGTIRMIVDVWSSNGSEPVVVAWDMVRCTRPQTEAADRWAAELGECGVVGYVAGVAGADDAVGIIHGADRLLADDPLFCQALWNARDVAKGKGACIILLGPTIELPASLRHDVVVLDEELPSAERLAAIVRQVDADYREAVKGERAPVPDETVDRAVEAVLGLSEFEAEQSLAMSLNGGGYNLDEIWARKRKAVSQTRGLSVYRGGERFTDLGGLAPVKGYLSAVMGGRRPPSTIAWIDEVEKTGLSAHGDMSGVSQDQEGTLLSWMEDRDIFGVMLLGVPGCGKSALCKAMGGEFGRPVIRVDLGAMQGSLVGESQQNVRAALKVVDATSGGNDILVLATSNSVDRLSAAMRSRFVDTFFFDLPTAEERGPIWRVWLAKYGLPQPSLRLPASEAIHVSDEGWVGRNIRRCVDKAWRMDVSLEEAAKSVVAVGKVEAEDIDRLRRQAAGRYLSASMPGVYGMPREAKTGRKMR